MSRLPPPPPPRLEANVAYDLYRGLGEERNVAAVLDEARKLGFRGSHQTITLWKDRDRWDERVAQDAREDASTIEARSATTIARLANLGIDPKSIDSSLVMLSNLVMGMCTVAADGLRDIKAEDLDDVLVIAKTSAMVMETVARCREIIARCDDLYAGSKAQTLDLTEDGKVKYQPPKDTAEAVKVFS